MLAIARRGVVDSLALGHHDDRGLQRSRGPRRPPPHELGLRAIVYLEVFGARARRGRAAVRARSEPTVERDARSSRSAISPHAPYTCSLDGLRVVPLARRAGRDAPGRERERERVAASTARARCRAIATSSCRRPGERAVRDARAGARARPALRALRRGRAGRRSRCSPSRGVPVAHCPRSNALLGCGVGAGRRSLREAGLRGVRPGTDSPVLPPRRSIGGRRCAAAPSAGRARSRATAGMHSPPADVLGSPDCWLGCCPRARPHDELGSLTPGRAWGPDGSHAGRKPCTIPLKIRSWPPSSAARPRAPYSKPSSTGRTRYLQARRTAWQEVRSTASAARRRMLSDPPVPGSGGRAAVVGPRISCSEPRVHVEWVFLLMAVVFTLGGFVFLGIGSGSNGITDAVQSLFNLATSANRPSLSTLAGEEDATEHPKDAAAWRDLATAYEHEAATRTDAIRALEQLHRRCKSEGHERARGARRAVHDARPRTTRTTTRHAQAQVAHASPVGATFAPAATTPLGKAFGDAERACKDPISSAAVQHAQRRTRRQPRTATTRPRRRTPRAPTRSSSTLTPNDADGPAPARPGRPGGQRHEDRDRRLLRSSCKLAPHDPLAPAVRSR